MINVRAIVCCLREGPSDVVWGAGGGDGRIGAAGPTVAGESEIALVRWGAEARDAEARGSMHRAKSSSPRLRIAAIYCNVISNFTNIFVSAVSPWVDGSAPQKWVIRRCETET